MRTRFAASVAVAAVFAVAFAPLAAADTLVTFTTSTTPGSGRTLTLATGPTLPVAATDLTSAQSVDSVPVTGSATTQVQDTFAADNNWHVTAEMCGLTALTRNDITAVPAKDCSRWVMDRLETPAATISGSDIHATTTSSVPTTGPGSTTYNLAAAAMTTPLTIMSNANKPAGFVDSGFYTASTSLHIQNLTQTGTWRGFWVVTLYP